MTVGELRDILAKLDNNNELMFRVSLPISDCGEMLDALCEYSGIGKVGDSVTIYLDEVRNL
uniref:Uncharacterized protein n=1 Tax=Siphoviridae sp. ct5d86 TaxID=2827561 RepID=A0A8S5LLP4_9CAUD|nr:MAG TPA: hypothetical protein [Siphoviridae sp. ct5d86]